MPPRSLYTVSTPASNSAILLPWSETYSLLLLSYCAIARPKGTRSLVSLLLRSGAMPSS